MNKTKNIFLFILFCILINLFIFNNLKTNKKILSKKTIYNGSIKLKPKDTKESINNNLFCNKNIILKPKLTASPLDSSLLSTENITSYFGYRVHPITYHLDFHTAIDIKAPYRSDIYTILSGKVKETGNSKIDGNYIIISHNNLNCYLESKYCHCDQIFKKKNDYVSKGQIISNVGHSGLATGNHLHIEIKINNINIDPLILIKLN